MLTTSDGFLILMFLPRIHYQNPELKPSPQCAVPVEYRVHPKLRFRVVQKRHVSWWKWAEERAAALRIPFTDDEATFVCIRLKKKTAGFKPRSQPLEMWVSEMFDGTVTLNMDAPVLAAPSGTSNGSS